jgi:ABC-type transporter Mla MlaB component
VDGPPQYSFYRLATIGWANPLLRQTLPLLSEKLPSEFSVDLSQVQFLDSFGIVYLAACLQRCESEAATRKVLIRRPRNEKVDTYLQDVGIYDSVGLGDRFPPRRATTNKVDLVHIQALEPAFIDSLLDFMEINMPFEPGLRGSIRMSLIELVQNFADHSGSEFGAWATGQKHQKRITFCMLDLGRGIPTTLRTVDKYRRHKDPHLIELATEDGVSSVSGIRGKGLTIIRQFVRSNGGAMTIISGNGRVRFRPDRRPMRDRIDGHFPGSAVFLSLVPTKRGLYVLE